MHAFAQAFTTVCTGIMIGFLGVGALARGIDTVEANSCPGVARIQVNISAGLGDWATWGACPRGGLIAPMKP